MATPEQKRADRVARLQRAHVALEFARSDAERFGDWSKVEAFKTALRLLDAVSCIEERAVPFADANGADDRVVNRLREIAADRDIFGARSAAEAKAKLEGGESTQ